MAVTWGMLPAMFAHRTRRRTGLMVLAPMVAVIGLLAVVRGEGLAAWAAKCFGGGQNFLHMAVGFLLALSLAWLAGARRLWLGLLGVALAGLSGGVGEIVQAATQSRSAEMSDWWMHLTGSAAVTVPYLLCMGSRLAESRDASPRMSLR